eukprot:GFYU01002743.1.p1 GENE.GFYU01002743.1~~GFYU01002743.1.p1  ORF type:complete len:653 (-),score=149.55 GFYU01002743.1:290-2248(-)
MDDAKRKEREERRKAREKEIEEKKRKIEEIKRQKEQMRKTASSTTSAVASTDSPSSITPTASKLQSPAFAERKTKQEKFTGEVDAILESLKTAPQSPKGEKGPGSVPGTPHETSFSARKLPSLGYQHAVCITDIAPKAQEVYAKETQTIPASTEDSDSDDGVSEAKNVSFHKSPAKTPTKDANLGSPISKGLDTSGRDHSLSVDSRGGGDGGLDGDDEDPIMAAAKVELTAQERKEIVQSEGFSDFFDSASRVIERALGQSETYDFMIDYGGGDESMGNEPQMKDRISEHCKFFDDRWCRHRSVTAIDWSTKHPELMLSSYNSRIDHNLDDPDGVVLVWSMVMPQRPEYTFQYQSAVTSAFFDKYNPTQVIGGTYSGQVVLWDMRAKNTPIQRTPLSSKGHTHPVFCMEIVGTENAHNLVTASTDGRVCVWSMGMFSQPQEVLELKNNSRDVATTCMSFPHGEVNGFYVGSEEGSVYKANRHGSKTGVVETLSAHHGPITSIDFHGGGGQLDFSDLYITSSIDWTVRLWSRKLDKPLHAYEDFGDYVYNVKWSPAHPALFAAADGSGNLQFWDIAHDPDVPVLKHSASSKAINVIQWGHDGKRIATGDSGGNLVVYDLASEVSVPRADDWRNMDNALADMRSDVGIDASVAA